MTFSTALKPFIESDHSCKIVRREIENHCEFLSVVFEIV